MIPGILADHPLRQALARELHARPYAEMVAPGRVLFIALMPEEGAAERDLLADRRHLTDLLDRHGRAHPEPDASHHLAELGGVRLKWDRHTEFASYTLFGSGPAETLFRHSLLEHLPEDWLAAAPGKVIAAIEVELLAADGIAEAEALLDGPLADALGADSVAAARILDGKAVAAGDFRIREGGFTRFALIVHDAVPPRRIGRAVQRLIEIETYRTLAMLALPVARSTSARLNEVEREVGDLTARVADAPRNREDPSASNGSALDAALLDRLSAFSAEIEALQAAAAFRFGAGSAYEALVSQRIAMLREERLSGRQLFAEFMLRRFDPAMRTCHAADRRLDELAERASRCAELLRTRVNVAVEAQNQEVLEFDEPPRRGPAPPAGDGRGPLGGGDQLLRGQPGGLSDGAAGRAGRRRQDRPDGRRGDPGRRPRLVFGAPDAPPARQPRLTRQAAGPRFAPASIAPASIALASGGGAPGRSAPRDRRIDRYCGRCSFALRPPPTVNQKIAMTPAATKKIVFAGMPRIMSTPWASASTDLGACLNAAPDGCPPVPCAAAVAATVRQKAAAAAPAAQRASAIRALLNPLSRVAPCSASTRIMDATQGASLEIMSRSIHQFPAERIADRRRFFNARSA